MARNKQHSRNTSPIDVWDTKTRTAPIAHTRIGRREEVSVVTSSFGGVMTPLKMIPLLREDGVNNGRLTLNVQMAETAAMLLNPVRISAAAYLVPKLALDRFADMGSIDRSYNGIAEVDGNVIDWFETAGASGPIYNTLGLHVPVGASVNTDYLESYNQVWNYIARSRSSSLTERALNDTTLAPAFCQSTQMKHVVPTFDDALIEGQVAIDGLNSRAPVSGLGIQTGMVSDVPGVDFKYTGGVSGRNNSFILKGNGSQTATDNWRIDEDPDNAGFPAVFAELAAAGASFSLAAIDQARQTAAWARMRQQFQGKDDDWMIDQLLSGIRLNDDALKQPMLLDARDTVVGMSQRYATDSGNLTKSVVDGRTAIDLSIRTPNLQCGGVIVVVAQALPEQIYERQMDHFFYASSVGDLPDRTADELDPQPISMVRNSEVDLAHTLPDDLFGYAPLNWEWQRKAPNIGGRYFWDDPLATPTEDRNRIWDSGAVDPVLGADFYTSTQLQHNVFESTNEDPFEWWLSGQVNISGLTYFGPSMTEGLDDYEKVQAQVDSSRLAGDGSDVPV